MVASSDRDRPRSETSGRAEPAARKGAILSAQTPVCSQSRDAARPRPHHPHSPRSYGLYAVVPRQLLEPERKAERRAEALNPLFTTRDHLVGSIGHAPIHSSLPTTMQSTPHPSLSNSTSGLQDEAPQASNVLPLRRTPIWSERSSSNGAPQQRSVPVPEPRPGAASEETTTPRSSDEPAWRQAFIAPNGVRFTRTPDRIPRERIPSAINAGGSEDGDDTAASGMSFGQSNVGLDAEAPALSSAQQDLICPPLTGVTDRLSFWFQGRYQVQQCATLGPLVPLAPSIDEAASAVADPILIHAAEAVPVQVREPGDAADIDLGYLRLYDPALLPDGLLNENRGSVEVPQSRAQSTTHEQELACDEDGTAPDVALGPVLEHRRGRQACSAHRHIVVPDRFAFRSPAE